VAVVKLRASEHSKDLRDYDITADDRIAVGRTLKGNQGLLTRTPSLDGKRRRK